MKPPRAAGHTPLGLGPIRRLGRNARQLAALAADNPTDERGKGRQMLGQAAAGLARIPLFQGLMDGTIAPKVVTHRIHLLIRWIFQRGYTMRQPLLNVYIKMSYKSVRWRRAGKGLNIGANLLRWPYATVVNDIKREHWNLNAGFREEGLDGKSMLFDHRGYGH